MAVETWHGGRGVLIMRRWAIGFALACVHTVEAAAAGFQSVETDAHDEGAVCGSKDQKRPVGCGRDGSGGGRGGAGLPAGSAGDGLIVELRTSLGAAPSKPTIL